MTSKHCVNARYSPVSFVNRVTITINKQKQNNEDSALISAKGVALCLIYLAMAQEAP